jgi:hypothetical protein
MGIGHDAMRLMENPMMGQIYIFKIGTNDLKLFVRDSEKCFVTNSFAASGRCPGCL